NGFITRWKLSDNADSVTSIAAEWARVNRQGIIAFGGGGTMGAITRSGVIQSTGGCTVPAGINAAGVILLVTDTIAHGGASPGPGPNTSLWQPGHGLPGALLPYPPGMAFQQNQASGLSNDNRVIGSFADNAFARTVYLLDAHMLADGDDDAVPDNSDNCA